MSRISLIKQALALRSYFPDSQIVRNGERELIWTHYITPSPLSNTYKIKIHYKKNEEIKIIVVEPSPLPLASGEEELPHVYSTPKQELCLYFPKDHEWDTSMYYVRTLIPWASEWLFHYEIWVGTGEWRGGGIEHNDKVG